MLIQGFSFSIQAIDQHCFVFLQAFDRFLEHPEDQHLSSEVARLTVMNAI